jgi:hypothetical protein
MPKTMDKNIKGKTGRFPLVLFLIPAFFLISCETGPDEVLEDIAGSTQRAIYNGRPIAFIVEPGFSVRYFSPADAPEGGGSPNAPVEPGRYAVRVEHRQAPGTYAAAMLIIEKAYINFLAEKKQEAHYDGRPKRVSVSSDPPVDFSFSYYPTEDIREEAVRTFFEDGRRQTAVKGFTRITHAPVEPGTYYVAVYFAGNEHYRPAVAELEFTIIGRVPDTF